MQEPKSMSRREWLLKGFFYGTVGTTLGTLGSILLDVWLAAGRFSPAHWTEVAAVDAINRDGAIPFPEKRVAIIHRNQKLAALSLECTHLGCLVNTVDQGFYCPCHGSAFGPLGEVYSAPAKEPLRWHDIQIRKKRVWIHTGKKHHQPFWISLNDDRIRKRRQEV